MTRLARAVAVLAAATCGAYTLVYLYRWEWHRAILAGVFLVVAEVALATAVLLRRLAALDRRLTEVVAGPGQAHKSRPAPGRAHKSRPAPGRARNPRSSCTCERQPPNLALPSPGWNPTASASSSPSSSAPACSPRPRPGWSRRWPGKPPGRHWSAAWPPGWRSSLCPPAASSATGRRPMRRARRAPAWPARLGLMTLATFGGAVGIDELADATQTRPDSVRAGVHTVVELQLHGELARAAPARMAASLWHTCEGALRRDLPEPVVTDLGGSRVQLALPVDIGTHALRRLHGCLEDAAFDRVQAGVTVRLVSAPG